jgi:ubiquitin thioesterase ZRANB1
MSTLYFDLVIVFTFFGKLKITHKTNTLNICILFSGVYLPLLWERSFCSKTPIALGYTRGHFSALVPMEIDSGIALAGAHIDNAVEEQVFYLPLVDHEGAFLPIHFVTGFEVYTT